MRRLSLAALLLAGCQGAPSTPAAPVKAALHQPADTAAQALNPKGFRAVILAAPSADDLEVYGLYYGLLGHGWRVSVALPEGGQARGRAGYPIPGQLSYAQVKPAEFDLACLVGGAPPAAVAVLKPFSASDIKGVCVTEAGRTSAQLKLAVATQEQGVTVMGNTLTAHRPGDVPRLVHALQAWAGDALRRAHQATGGHPP